MSLWPRRWELELHDLPALGSSCSIRLQVRSGNKHSHQVVRCSRHEVTTQHSSKSEPILTLARAGALTSARTNHPGRARAKNLKEGQAVYISETDQTAQLATEMVMLSTVRPGGDTQATVDRSVPETYDVA